MWNIDRHQLAAWRPGPESSDARPDLDELDVILQLIGLQHLGNQRQGADDLPDRTALPRSVDDSGVRGSARMEYEEIIVVGDDYSALLAGMLELLLVGSTHEIRFGRRGDVDVPVAMSFRDGPTDILVKVKAEGHHRLGVTALPRASTESLP
jgi:hypothetical protein